MRVHQNRASGDHSENVFFTLVTRISRVPGRQGEIFSLLLPGVGECRVGEVKKFHFRYPALGTRERRVARVKFFHFNNRHSDFTLPTRRSECRVTKVKMSAG